MRQLPALELHLGRQRGDQRAGRVRHDELESGCRVAAVRQAQADLDLDGLALAHLRRLRRERRHRRLLVIA